VTSQQTGKMFVIVGRRNPSRIEPIAIPLDAERRIATPVAFDVFELPEPDAQMGAAMCRQRSPVRCASRDALSLQFSGMATRSRNSVQARSENLPTQPSH
jgi:hypothetical protein